VVVIVFVLVMMEVVHLAQSVQQTISNVKVNVVHRDIVAWIALVVIVMVIMEAEALVLAPPFLHIVVDITVVLFLVGQIALILTTVKTASAVALVFAHQIALVLNHQNLVDQRIRVLVLMVEIVVVVLDTVAAIVPVTIHPYPV